MVMYTLIIKKSFNTPDVHFDAESGELKLEGRSIPENPENLYMKMIRWIHEYFENPKELTRAVINLEYVNSGSSKFLLEILRVMKKYHDRGNSCVVDWYYEEEDERIMELGLHYKSTTELPFNMHEIY